MVLLAFGALLAGIATVALALARPFPGTGPLAFTVAVARRLGTARASLARLSKLPFGAAELRLLDADLGVHLVDACFFVSVLPPLFYNLFCLFFCKGWRCMGAGQVSVKEEGWTEIKAHRATRTDRARESERERARESAREETCPASLV